MCIRDRLCRVVFIAPMLKWLLDTIKKLNKDVSTLQELDNDINNNETKTMQDLQDIQKVIFQHRKGCYACLLYTSYPELLCDCR